MSTQMEGFFVLSQIYSCYTIKWSCLDDDNYLSVMLKKCVYQKIVICI